MKNEDYIEFIVDYTHNIYSCENHEGKEFIDPIRDFSIVKVKGIYNKEEIGDYFNTWSKISILQILSLKSLNLLQLKKILGYSYGSLHSHIKKMKKLKLITIEKSKSEKGKIEKKIKLHNNVKIMPLSKSEKNNILTYLDEQIKNSENGKKEFEEGLNKELEKISKEPTNLRAKKHKKGRGH